MEPVTWNIPVMPLRGLVVFPHMNLTFDVERRLCIAAMEKAMEAEQDIFLVTQREISEDFPGQEDLYEVGTVSHITQLLRLSPTAVRVMVEGRCRARLRRLWQTDPFLQGNVEELPETPLTDTALKAPRTEALLRQTWGLFTQYAEMAGNVADEIAAAVMDCRDPAYLADFITQNIPLRHPDKINYAVKLNERKSEMPAAGRAPRPAS